MQGNMDWATINDSIGHNKHLQWVRRYIVSTGKGAQLELGERRPVTAILSSIRSSRGSDKKRQTVSLPPRVSPNP
jgi:hypothetical protein